MRFKQLLGLDTLRGQLRFYSILLVVLPLILATLFFSLFQRRHIINTEIKHLVYGLRQESNVVRSWMDERFADARFFASLDAAQRGDLKDLVQYFKNYVEAHPYLPQVIYIKPEGTVGATNFGQIGMDVGDRMYFKEALAGRSFMELIPKGRLTGNPACIFSVPIRKQDGTFGGVLAISVFLGALDRWLRETVSYFGSTVILCDTHGRILAPSSAVIAGGGPGKAQVSPQLLAAGERGAAYVDAAGREMIGAAVLLERSGWRLASEVPVSAVLAGYRRQSLWLLAGVLATILLVMPLLVRFSSKLERPLMALAAYARELRTTQYTAAFPPEHKASSIRELAELHEAFSVMAGEIRTRIEAAEQASVQDALTGLYNRRFLFSGGAKLLEAARRAGRPCACLMLDVDHFKVVNDTYGHTVGDLVLRHLGEVLLASVRRADLVARYGGEEFVVFLTGADNLQAVTLAERVRRNLAESPCRTDGLTLAVTVSIGVALARDKVEYGESPLEDLLARADKALYAAKAAGRDRVMTETTENMA